MPPHFSDMNDLNLLSSRPFEIIAESGKRFFIHSAILTAQSEALRSITTGVGGLEIDLSDWDENTVARLVQFLYFGDYQVPKPTLEEEEETEEAKAVAGAAAKVEAEAEAEVEGEDCERRDGTNTPDTVQSLANLEEQKTGDTNVLLVHAKLYTLAHHKNIGSLRRMALERLKTALREIDSQITPKVALKVIDLFAYVNSHINLGEPMRDLVSTFVADNIEKLISRGEMTALFGNQFAVELVKRMVVRIGDAEKKCCDMEKEGQAWKAKSALLSGVIQELEVTKVKELEERLRQLGVSNAETVQELKVAYQKILEAISAKTQFSKKLRVDVHKLLITTWNIAMENSSHFDPVIPEKMSKVFVEAENEYNLELKSHGIQGGN